MAKNYRLGLGRRGINVLVTALLKGGLGPRGTYLLTTTGRKSGLPRTTPVTLVEEEGGQRWLVCPYGQVAWVHNIRANPTVTLRRGRDTRTLQTTETDADTAGPVLQRYLREVRVTAPFFDATPDSPPEAFVAEAATHPVFALTPPQNSLPPKE